MKNIKKNPLQIRGLVDEMINQFCEMRKENIDLKAENRRINRDRDLGSYYKKELEKTRSQIDVYEERILELRQERNKLKRELNRIEYNNIKIVAMTLANMDEKVHWAFLDKEVQKSYREYAYIYIKKAFGKAYL